MVERLFRYQRYNKNHLIDLLENKRIKLSRPDKFNDPWDCRPHFRVPETISGIKDAIDWFETSHRKQKPEVSEEVRAQLVRGLYAVPSRLGSAFEQLNDQLYKAICEQYRVYCMSEAPDQALMWAHYADSHTGLCLEFDITVPPFGPNNYMSKIAYRDEYPAYNVSSPGYEPLIVKAKDWSYEKEWRLIAEERKYAMSEKTVKTDNDFCSISDGSLKSVIIGALAPSSDVTEITAIITSKAPHVAIRRATISMDRYKISIDPAIY